MRLDPDDLRRYASRDWGAAERLARRARAATPVEDKIAIAVELYETARRSRPGWPDEKTRREDLAAHIRMRRLLSKAAHVGTR